MSLIHFAEPTGSAWISDRGRRRFRLCRVWRPWREGSPLMLFVGFNPSTADAREEDPTVRRCKAFAAREGCVGFELVNLFSQRATDPREVLAEPEPPETLDAIRACLERCQTVVVAWGTPACSREVRRAADERAAVFVAEARAAGRELACLGTTQTGAPRHPLYLRADAPLVPWSPPC